MASVNALALFASIAVLLPAQAGQGQPATIHASLKEAFMFNGLRYTVLSVKDGLPSYTQKYDQRQETFSPGYKTECLTVVDLVVENPTDSQKRFTSLLPALTYGEGSNTDHSQWDVEQRSMVKTTSAVNINPQELYSYSQDPVMVAAGGQAHFAIAFSHPTRSKATKLSFQPGVTTISSGVVITNPAEGPTAIVSFG